MAPLQAFLVESCLSHFQNVVHCWCTYPIHSGARRRCVPFSLARRMPTECFFLSLKKVWSWEKGVAHFRPPATCRTHPMAEISWNGMLPRRRRTGRTAIRSNVTWTNPTHLGAHYAAAERPPSPVTDFSGYRWRLRAPSSHGGHSIYSSSNIRSMSKVRCTCRSPRRRRFGVAHKQPDAKSSPRHVRIWRTGTGDACRSLRTAMRWPMGDPAKEHARYLLQPYYVAANVHHFNEPAGTLTEVAP